MAMRRMPLAGVPLRASLGPSLSSASRRYRQGPLHASIVAILVHRHALSTETSQPSGRVPSGPPPGFSAKEAQKPLAKTGAASSTLPLTDAEKLAATQEMLKVPREEPTAVPKTAVPDKIDLAETIRTELAGKTSDLKTAITTAGGQALTAEGNKKDGSGKKLTLMQKIKKEVLHYWDGTKLLATEVKISTKLAVKMAAGYELSRREDRQLRRTVQDLARLVPFSVFVIVPFAEFLLPVALKIFPNLLPSTYEGQKTKEAKAKTLRATRKEVSNLLRHTLKETGLPVSPANAQRDEFTEFFRKVRATGESPTQADVIKVCKIFKDDLTLDNLSRPQLVGMARYMNLNTFGTDMMLRYQIRHRMRQIKRDDRAISFEGVDSLSVPELQMACASRGLRTHGLSPGRLREDLQTWLDLRLKYGVPSTLLVLSNAFMYSAAPATANKSGADSDEMSSQIDALTGVLSSIPEELFHEIELEVHTAEGAATNKQRLEVLREQQELIDEENEQNGRDAAGESAAPRDDQNIDDGHEPGQAPADADEVEMAPEAGSEVEVEAVAESADSPSPADDEAQTATATASASEPTPTSASNATSPAERGEPIEVQTGIKKTGDVDNNNEKTDARH
ncbi:MAG: hypothetical protein M1826_007660 [Phylliscum demangeonii]|nr:MAG: hypothetical protein M1826_007660 [Phylliscum demangeonii]